MVALERRTDRYPAMIAEVNRVEPAPRRVRAFLGGALVFDTTRALYVWESPSYPQYYVPLADVRRDLLVEEGTAQQSERGLVDVCGLRVGDAHRPHAARVLRASDLEGLSGTVRFEWASLDAWFEEDERIFVHPRNPYVRVDALRSTRRVRIELDGAVLGESSSPSLMHRGGSCATARRKRETSRPPPAFTTCAFVRSASNTDAKQSRWSSRWQPICQCRC